MTEKNNSDDEAQTSASTQSRFAKFESPHDVDSKESTDDGDDNDEDKSLLSGDKTGADSDSDSDSDSVTNIDTNTDTSASDSKEQVTSDSRSNHLWSDAAITDTTNSNSDTPDTTSLSSDNSGDSSDNTSDATISVDSTQQSTDPATDNSRRDSDRIWNQPSRSDSTEETSTTGNQDNDNSVNVDQTDIPEEIPTNNNQSNDNSVNTGQIDSSVAPQSQTQAPSSLDNVSAGGIQTDNNALTDGSQALLLGEDSPGTWNTGFSHILEPQQPQNLLLLVPAGETVDILRVCQEHPSWDGGEIIIIKAGASVPGDMSVAELSGDGMKESIETHQISDQTDLSRLGILITQVLNNWQKPDQKTVCSVHTLQAFLQYLSPQKVFQFLYTLSRRLQSADIETTYLMTPSDGDRTINTLRPIFDTVIET